MRALTVQQPWAHALAHEGKVENRSWPTKYRGPLAIHAGTRLGPASAFAEYELNAGQPAPQQLVTGAIIAVGRLVDVHQPTTDCVDGACYPWGWLCWEDDLEKPIWHWVLAGVKPLPVPLPCKGRLQLWTPPPDTLDELREAL